MADKRIGELPKAASLQDDSLLVMEQQGTAQSVTGSLVKQYAEAAAKGQADAAAKSAEAAKTDADRAAEKAQDAADVALHPPKIQGGNWWTWDTATKAYVDSGVDASVSLSIAETVTGAPGDPAKVENVGTATDPKLKFTIPLGNQGPVSSVDGQSGNVISGAEWTSIHLDQGYWEQGSYQESLDAGLLYDRLKFVHSARIRTRTVLKIPASVKLIFDDSSYNVFAASFDSEQKYLKLYSGWVNTSGYVYQKDGQEYAAFLIAHKDGANITTDEAPQAKLHVVNTAITQSVNGRTGDVVVGARNYVALSKCSAGFVGDSGTLFGNDYARRTDYIPLHGARQVTVRVSGTAGSYISQVGLWAGITFHDADKKFLSPRLVTTSKKLGEYESLTSTYDVPQTAEYVICAFHYSNVPDLEISLTFGNVATDWTPAPEDKADVPLQFDIKLPASSWANGSQTVTDARFVDGDYDWDVDVKGACIPWDGITITAGQMVAKADIVPTTDMTWTVTRREVRRDG